MTRRQNELALRRQTLQLRSDRLRRSFGAEAAIIEESFEHAERAIGAVRRLSPLLLLVAGGAVVFLVRWRTQALAWLTRGLVAVSLIRRASALMRALASRSPPRE